MLDHKMDPDLLFDVREFLVSTLEDEKLSDNTKSIRMDLIRRVTTAQSFLSKPYQDMKSSPKKDKSSSELIIHNLHHYNSLSDTENTYENESCTSSGGSTSGAGSIECYEEIDHVNPSPLAANNTYENISKVSPSPTMSVLSTSQYNEITAHISNNVHISTQYENTKQMLNSMNANSPSIMSTKHGHVEIVNKANGPKGDVQNGDAVDGDIKNGLRGSNSVPNGLANGLKADRKASNGSVVSLHDVKFSGLLPVDYKAAETDTAGGKHKALNGSMSYPLGGQQNNTNPNNSSSNNNSVATSKSSNTLPTNSSLSNLSASTKNLSNMNANNVEILSISASALKYSAARCGILLKKEKILFVDHFKKYWVALVNGYLYLYNNDKDNKASSVINVFSESDGTSIYLARPSMSKEKENLLEIVAPGLKTHYFAANSLADMELWISAINQSSLTVAANSSTKSSPPASLTSVTSASSGANFSAPSGGPRQPSPPASRPVSETCRELPSLPLPVAPEQYYDEPDSLIRPVLHNYEHMICQDSLYNEIDEKESINENYYNNISHSPIRQTDSTALARKLEEEKLRELCMLTYDQPKSSRKCIVELDEEAGDEKNCEETTELFQNSQSSRIQTIIQRMEASINTKDTSQATPPLRRSKRPESQLIISNQTYEPIRRKSTNRNSR